MVYGLQKGAAVPYRAPHPYHLSGYARTDIPEANDRAHEDG